jgi:hypothetical protein
MYEAEKKRNGVSPQPKEAKRRRGRKKKAGNDDTIVVDDLPLVILNNSIDDFILTDPNFFSRCPDNETPEEKQQNIQKEGELITQTLIKKPERGWERRMESVANESRFANRKSERRSVEENNGCK